MQFARVRLTALLTSLVCFTFPWFSVSCHGPDGTSVVISQSGLEAAIGETTTLVNGQAPPANQQAPEEFREPPAPAMLLAVHGMAIVLAILGSLLIKPADSRWLVVTLLSGVAAGVLIVQVAVGFPLLKDAPKDAIEYSPWFWLAIATTVAAPIASLCERVRLAPDPEREDGTRKHSDLTAWDDAHLG